MTTSRTTIAAGSALAAAAVLLIPGTAEAANTTLNLTVAGGALAVSAPASVTGTLSAVAATFNVPNVQVSDQRGQLVATWTAKSGLSDFIGSGTAATHNVLASTAAYVPGVATAPADSLLPLATAVGVPVASMTLAEQTVMTGAGVGNNGAVWSPTITSPATNWGVAGTYTATLTHSVA